ncbi:MAG: hypothetical protein AB1813_07060 [Verrucomicrobiota bacterium]
MRTSSFITILVAAIFGSLAQLSAADKIDGFNKLAAGETLQMRFTSRGCFHFYTYDVTFTRKGKPTASVVAVRLEWVGPDITYRDAEWQELGALTLSESDLSGLETLLAFYRSNTNSGCTTKDTIKISQIRDGKVIATEQFTDASGSAHEVKGVLTIPSLARRLPERKEKKSERDPHALYWSP